MRRPSWVSASNTSYRDAQLLRLNVSSWVPQASDFPREFCYQELLNATSGAGGRVALTSKLLRAYWRWIFHPRGLLDIRDRVGPVYVSSFERISDGTPGCHERGEGSAVDLVPADRNFRRLHRVVAQLAEEAFDQGEPIYSEILDEERAAGGAHVHLSWWPCGALDGRPKILYIEQLTAARTPVWKAGFAPASTPVGIAIVGAGLLVTAALLFALLR